MATALVTGGRRALTLIEVLVSMSILAILVLLIGIIINAASGAFTEGRVSTRMIQEGRAIMDILVDDLEGLSLGTTVVAGDWTMTEDGSASLLAFDSNTPGLGAFEDVYTVEYRLDKTTTVLTRKEYPKSATPAAAAAIEAERLSLNVRACRVVPVTAGAGIAPREVRLELVLGGGDEDEGASLSIARNVWLGY